MIATALPNPFSAKWSTFFDFLDLALAEALDIFAVTAAADDADGYKFGNASNPDRNVFLVFAGARI